ncbi:MAG: helix-hairpin-helix domain-containing protein [Bacillota bacterium]|nr:helix-hairpin-helix domain-containing protein [Bacillota bacterium]
MAPEEGAYDGRTVAERFREIADLMELLDHDVRKAPAYRRAAAAVERRAAELPELVRAGRATEIPGVGPALARKAADILATGTCDLLERLRAQVPEGVRRMLELRGLGPRSVAALWRAGIDEPEALAEAAAGGRLRALPGFGPQKERALLEALRLARPGSGLWLGEAWTLGRRLAALLGEAEGVLRVEVAGAVRRAAEQVERLDLVLGLAGSAAGDGRPDVPEPARRIAEEAAAAAGIPVRLHPACETAFGAVLLAATGDEAHLAALEPRLRARGLELDAGGLRRGTELLATPEEADAYAALGLPWIPAELRERPDVVESAARGALPRLIEAGDLQGDLHVHTAWSDGRASLEAMAEAAEARGYRYVAITDHSPSLRIANGLDTARLKAQWEEIARIQARHPAIRLLRGSEVDVLADGRLDHDQEALAGLEWVNASVHSRFSRDASEQNRRLRRAMEEPATCAVAHPGGRRLGLRAPYALDAERLIEDALELGVALEVNASPERLDLTWEQAAAAHRAGVTLVLSSDAHSPEGLGALELGIRWARRAGLGPEAFLNAQPLEAVLEHAARRRRGGADGAVRARV